VSGDERLRLFLALRLPDDVLDQVERWQHEQLGGVRIVPREHLHVTLAFLGHRPAGELEPIVDVLRGAAAGAEEIRLTPVRYRETRSVGMLALDDADGHASALADVVQGRLEELRVYERERRRWFAHLTVLRFRRPPRLAAPLPDLGVFSPSEAAVYHSVLRPTGAQYEVVESVPLGS
jgi:2'-5' RNA ligase